MLSDARTLWNTASTAFATINENLNQALENFDADNARLQDERNKIIDKEQLLIDLEEYKKLLDNAQMDQFELSKQSRLLIAEKEAEIQVLKSKMNITTTDNGEEAENMKDNLKLQKLQAERDVLEQSLKEVEEKLREAIHERNEYLVTKKNYLDILNRFEEMKAEYSKIKSDKDLNENQKNETIENLVQEYSQLAAETELIQAESHKRVLEITKENEVLVTKLHALEHSIEELANRSTSQKSNLMTRSDSSNSTDQAALPNPPNDELREARNKLVTLQFDLKEKEEEIIRLKEKALKAAQESNNSGNSDNSHSKLQLLEVEEKLTVAEKTANKLQNEVTNLNRDVSRLVVEKREAEEAGKKYLDLTKKLQEDLQKLELNKNADTEIQSKEDSAVLEDLRNKYENLMKEKEEIKVEKEKQEQLSLEAQQKLELIEKEKNDNTEKVNQEKEKMAKDYEEKFSELENKLKNTKEESEKYEKHFKEVQFDFENFKKSSAAGSEAEKENLVTSYVNQIKDLQTSLEIEKENKINLENLINELKTNQENLQNEKNNLISTHSDEINELKENFEKMKKEEIFKALEEATKNAKDQLEVQLSEQKKNLEDEFNTKSSEEKKKLEEEMENALQSLATEKETEKTKELEALTEKLKTEKENELKELENRKNTEKETEVHQVRTRLEAETEEKLKSQEIEFNGKMEELAKNREGEIAEIKGKMEAIQHEFTVVEDKYKAITAEAVAEAEKKGLIEKEQAVEAQRVKMQGEVDRANAEKEEHMANYSKERKLRKQIHNKLLELQGNIRVLCRVRPILEVERKSGEGVDVTEIPNDDELILTRDTEFKTKYEYDRVFKQTSTQEEVFEAVQPLCVSVLDGFNVCIFAYGQTGSGKTFTMEGYGDNIGVSPRAIAELLKQVDVLKESWDYVLNLSMLEIYNETILDLLAGAGKKEKLDIRQTPEGNQVVGLSEITITDMDQVRELMKQGQANRAVGSHDMNAHSSRSHSILTITARGKNKIDQSSTFGKLNLIDLAGSERVGKTDATGERLKEAQNINKSLSALGDVVNALGNKKSTHVPYRNSKLTFLLQDSLGGNSKVLTFVNISPAVYNLGETVCSLNFASRCRSTELGTAKKQSDESASSKRERKLSSLGGGQGPPSLSGAARGEKFSTPLTSTKSGGF